jgi:hypothetical protein
MTVDFKGLHGAALRIPGISTKKHGHTGIDKSLIRSHEDDHSLEDVINVLKEIPKTKYCPDIWDCDDRALYAISVARCKYPDMPVGLAFNGNHAVIILWDKDFSRAEYYDPGLENTITFDAEVIIPFPLHGKRKGDGIPKASSLTFLDKGGAFVLDGNYHFSKEKLAAAKQFLIDGAVEECTAEKSKCTSHWGEDYSEFDRYFSWFINSRKTEELKGSPIGFAFGSEINGEERAYLLFWEDAKLRPSYWRARYGRVPKEKEDNFKPNIIIV